jgi:hypothetical protein
LPREGIQLLDTSDGGVFNVLIGTMLVECSVDLASAKNDSVNLLRLVDRGAMFRVGNDPLEL